MVTPRSRRVSVAALFILAGAAQAQWATDPAVNMPVATTASSEVLTKVAATPDGGCWVSWFVSVPGPVFYHVRLQLFDAAGVPQLGPDGILVGDKVQDSSTVDYDLRSDSAGNALITYTDKRDGGSDREVVAYRISPTGTFLWGPDGVLLSNNTNFEANPKICQTSDGNFCVVWPRTDQPTGAPPRGLIMQRLDAAGTKLLGTDGVLIAGSGVGGAGASDGPAWAEMVPAEDGSVIVLYANDSRSFTSPRHPTIQKYSTTGAGVWNGGIAIKLQASPIVFANPMNLVSDGAGGAIAAWYDTRRGGTNFDCWVQRLSAAGAQAFPAGGSAVSINNNDRIHLSPSDPVAGPGGETYIAWREENANQSQWGVHAQKFDAAGARQWGDGGTVIAPVDGVNDSFVRAAAPPAGDAGIVVAFKSDGDAISGGESMSASRLDAAGMPVWPGAPIAVSTAGSQFGRMPITRAPDGGVILAWEDSRGGAITDIYAQRINPDGTLGGPAGVECAADFNETNSVSVQDIYDFLADWNAAISGGTPSVGNPDFNGVGGVTVQDIYDFLAAWNAGCE